MNCPKCTLPLNADHAHRTYEEHDACRNEEIKRRVDFYDALDQVTPPYVRERWNPKLPYKVFVPDTTMRLAEMFANVFHEKLPTRGEDFRDVLYVFGMMADHEAKRLCNHYAKIAMDALNTRTFVDINLPFPEAESKSVKKMEGLG